MLAHWLLQARGMQRMRRPFGPGCSVRFIASSASTAAAPPDCASTQAVRAWDTQDNDAEPMRRPNRCHVRKLQLQQSMPSKQRGMSFSRAQ